ncbi:Gfo/Idh/MocA family protein [Pyrinomonas methylaliphatogenes]|uniref:Predicted dehydrogenase n=1 Tax=Pyrinomonas methylaliphatogenes TaxID=454194 RepID=A0A0B6WWH5_9BACT|nr:Gfo/Idh/MocA family oxidoreductase [Pyrinomonas methylaliphatogenes]MBX5479271.1 Gfo/Idh/MocA family oxidoreductase [Pyrinomonas methylaliphatogenes]CDM64609.1 predicted dehydrogenase [Pyrinomonas methylaliphatogenes]
MKRMNVAMIGYRFMGKAHSNAWRQVARFFDVPIEPVMKVICGRNGTEVRKAAEKYGWQEHATDWREVIERKDIDIIDICTPGDSHHDIAVAAAEAGKAILCEKPLANTLAEAERMLAAVERAGVTHMVCHNYRRAPAVALAKELIERGELGQIYHYRGTYLQDWIVDPNFPRVWRLERAKAGSGALGDIASHSIDLARYLVGEITEVASLLETFIKERPSPDDPTKRLPVDVDDAALALCRFENGAIGTIEASRFATGRKNYNRFEINGSRGSLVFNLERMNELELYIEEGSNSGFRQVIVTEPDHPYIAAWFPPGHIIGYEHTFTHTVLDFLKAIDEGRLPQPNFRDGLRNQRVLAAIERAHASRVWERV